MSSDSAENEVYIDPQVEPILRRMQEMLAERGPVGTATPETMRQRFNNDVRAWNEDLPELASVVDRFCSCSVGSVPVRLYDPDSSAESLPVLIFIHGGGWIVGDLDTNERTLRLLARESGVRILSVDYPLAPENPFPAGLDTCVAVARWVRAHGDDWGLDTERVCVGGDSAGGNLALATALDLRDAGENWLRYMLLIYPALAPESDSASHLKFGNEEYGLGTRAMSFFWSSYLATPADRNNPRAALLLADKSGLPCCDIVTAGLDPLTDDAVQLDRQLQAAGVPVTSRHYPGVIHGFFSMSLFLDAGVRAVRDAAGSLRALIAKEDPGPAAGQ